MYGLEAINAHNGWAISAVGITIVFSGLVTLSLVISQLHKVLAFYEDPSKLKELFKPKKKEEASETDVEGMEDLVVSSSQKETFKQFALLARTMADHFSLPRLLHMAKISGLKDPYTNLNTLLKIKIIVPDGDGYFTWNKARFDKAVE